LQSRVTIPQGSGSRLKPSISLSVVPHKPTFWNSALMRLGRTPLKWTPYLNPTRYGIHMCSTVRSIQMPLPSLQKYSVLFVSS